MDTSQLFCIISWVIIGLIILFTFLLAFKSNILRDSIDNPAAFMSSARLMKNYTGISFDDIPRPYSLARTQLALWTAIISSTYIHLTLCIKDCSIDLKSSATALALLGISTGTTAFANVIDQSQSNNKTITPRHQNQPSQGFWLDILSDENGISIHRLQNVIWTIVAISIYLYKVTVAPECHLPDLDGTLVSLTGISSVAYLGLKMNENK